MNIMPSLRHIAFASLTLGALLSQAWATSCGGGPGIFNVFENGKVAINQSLSYANSSGTCNVSFSGSSWANVGSSDLYGPLAQNANEQTCPLQATDQYVSKLSLPSFPTTAQTPNIKIYNWNGPTSGFSLTYNGTDYNYNYCTDTQGQTLLKFWVVNGQQCKKQNEVTSNGVVNFPTAGDANAYFTLTGNSFGKIELWSAPASFSGTGDILIDHLFSQNQAKIDLPGGKRYFVRKLELNDNYKLTVSGTSGARLYISQVEKMNGNGSCININGNCDGNNSSVTLTGQNPEKLAIYVYNGDLTLQDRTQIAASIYVHDGDLKLNANSNFSFIGEAVAKNIAVTNNSGVRMQYQDTDAFNLIYPTFGSGRTGLYSPARPAVPQVASIGDYSFIAYQSDYSSSANQKNYGTLRAYALRADGTTETTAAWDANNLMTESDRRSKLYVDVNGTAVAVGSLTLANLTTIGLSTTGLAITDVQNRIAQGPGAILSSKWQGMLGKPNATQPVIFKDMVLFTTSEGILYALDRQTGALRWGWVPKDLVGGFVSDSAYEAQLAGEGMKGQINAVTINGVDYVMGTAKNGEIHYGLQLNATTGLPARVWYDVRAGKTSPNAEKPVVYLDRAVYVVDDKVIVRPVAGGNPDTDPNSAPNVGGGTIKSSPTIVQTGTNYNLLVGTSNGYVMTASLASNGNLGSFNQVGYTGFNEAITYVVYTKTVDYEYVTAQSKTRVTTFKRRVNTTNNWTKIWSTTLGSASEWDFATGTSKGTTTVPALPGTGEITDRVTSLGGYIGIPFTIPASGDSCDGTARLYLAPLDPTLSYYAIYYLGQSFSDPYLALGTGNALSAQGMYLDGRMMMQGHSEKNLTGAEGLDNPLEFVPIPPNKGPGRKSWREVLVN